jgi:hypothetical protein
MVRGAADAQPRETGNGKAVALVELGGIDSRGLSVNLSGDLRTGAE